MEVVNRRGICSFKERRIMEILIYMAAIFVSLAIVAWVKDLDDEEEDNWGDDWGEEESDGDLEDAEDYGRDSSGRQLFGTSKASHIHCSNVLMLKSSIFLPVFKYSFATSAVLSEAFKIRIVAPFL